MTNLVKAHLAALNHVVVNYVNEVHNSVQAGNVERADHFRSLAKKASDQIESITGVPEFFSC